jgi:hypothetical protein
VLVVVVIVVIVVIVVVVVVVAAFCCGCWCGDGDGVVSIQVEEYQAVKKELENQVVTLRNQVEVRCALRRGRDVTDALD